MAGDEALAEGEPEQALVPARLDVEASPAAAWIEAARHDVAVDGLSDARELMLRMRSLRSAILSWDGGGLICSVYVRRAGGEEQLVARGRAGSKCLDWIRANERYEFRLYADQPDADPLAAVTVELPSLPNREWLDLLRRSPAYAAAVQSELEASRRALTDTRRRERFAADAAAAEALGLTRGAPLLAELVAEYSLDFDRCLSLGCNTGELERRMLADGVGRRFDGIGLVPSAIEEARRKAADQGLDIAYSVGDLSALELVPDRYDLVVADGCLSRELALEHVVHQIWLTLKPSGFLWIRDYVGERRFQYAPERLALANAALERLPSHLRWDDVDSREIESAAAPRADELGLFEAVRSDELWSRLSERFAIVRKDDYDAILHLVCPVGTRSAFLQDEEGRAAFNDLLQLDELLIRTGALTGTSASMLLTKIVTRPIDLNEIAARVDGHAHAAADPSFRAELNACINEVRVHLPGFDTLSAEKQAAVVDLAFDLGPGELARLEALREALQERDWLRACTEVERLPWFERSGQRAVEVRQLLASPPRKVAFRRPGLGALPPTPPAEVYRPVQDLCVISSFFNPSGYETKPRNLEAFIQPIERGGLGWLLIECAFGSDPFVLPPGPNIVHRRAASVLWQKERLLNLLIDQLPDRYTKVAWVDADILFANPDWAVETSALLDDYELVQPYEYVVRLPEGVCQSPGSILFSPTSGKYIGENRHWPGFAAAQVDGGADIGNAHGHPGFAWAARRELLSRRTLYDRCIAGGGDHFLVHASVGDWCSSCATNATGGVTPLLADASVWAEAWYGDIGGRIAFVPGVILHLWHGQYERRQYNLRGFELSSLGFDPRTDLRISDNGCWEWAADKPELQRWAVQYFDQRLEDG